MKYRGYIPDKQDIKPTIWGWAKNTDLSQVLLLTWVLQFPLNQKPSTKGIEMLGTICLHYII